MFEVAIVDDDAFSQEMLSDILSNYFPQFHLQKQFYLLKDALKNLESSHIDLVFLDVELPDGKGFDLLEQLDKIDFEVIITTMHESYMLKAIQHSAIDYLIKPIERNELSAAIARFEKKIFKAKPAKISSQAVVTRISKIALPTHDGLVLLELSDIVRLESEGAYTKFITSRGDQYMTSKSIGHYEDQLKAHSFFRVHHSHLINLSHVNRYVKGEGGYVIMTDNSNVDVSRRKKEDFLKALGL